MIFSSPVMSATWPARHAGDDLVVDLARQEPERQPDDADIVGEHALDGEMGLAGIGRAEHGGDAAPALESLWNAGRKTGSSLDFFIASLRWKLGTRGERISSESLTLPIRISFRPEFGTGLLARPLGSANSVRDPDQHNLGCFQLP